MILNAFVIYLKDEWLRNFSYSLSLWLIKIFVMSSCDRCIGTEKSLPITDFISNDVRAVLGPIYQKARTLTIAMDVFSVPETYTALIITWFNQK